MDRRLLRLRRVDLTLHVGAVGGGESVDFCAFGAPITRDVSKLAWSIDSRTFSARPVPGLDP